MDVQVEQFAGPRSALRPLFELAESSVVQLDSYLDAGRVLVAVLAGGDIAGHLQLVRTEQPGQLEVKNTAVREDLQGRGIGARLMRAAAELAAAESVPLLVVATAAADVGNLRFYQRQGFRMRAIERDAFVPATGYPDPIDIDGIQLRDRVWLDRVIAPRHARPARR